MTVDSLKYGGFCIVATGVAFSRPMMVGPFFPYDTVTTYTSNQARAHLTAEGGPPLNCQFLFDGPRAVGECRTPEGAVYQLVAEEKQVGAAWGNSQSGADATAGVLRRRAKSTRLIYSVY